MNATRWRHSLPRSLCRTPLSFVPLLLVLTLTASETALGCSVCYGNAEGEIIDALNFSIIFMLGVTYFILGTFLFFFIKLRKRERLFSPPSQSVREQKDDGQASPAY